MSAIEIHVRRSTVLADARDRHRDSSTLVVVGRRCATCPRVGLDLDEAAARKPGPFSSPAFVTGLVIAVVVSAYLMSGIIGGAR